jgi:hypothetical protein
MNRKNCYLVDPYLLASPEGTPDPERVSHQIRCLIDWAKLNTDHGYMNKVLVSLKSIRKLRKENRYFLDKTEPLLKKCGLDTKIDINTLKNALDCLTNCGFLEYHSGISEILYEIKEITPDFYSNRLSNLRSVFEDALVNIGCWQFYEEKRNKRNNLAIASILFDNKNTNASQIVVNAQIHDLESPGSDSFRKQPPPDNLIEKINIYFTASSLMPKKSVYVLWDDAINKDNVREAIDMYLYEYIDMAKCKKDKILRYRLGDNFCKSAKRWNYTVSEKNKIDDVLERCAEILTREYRHPTKPWKEDGKPLIRNGAKLMRIHLSETHGGPRLVYWKLRDNNIELSHIENKNDAFVYPPKSSYI